MPLISKYSNTVSKFTNPKVKSKTLLNLTNLENNRLNIELIEMDSNSEILINNSETSISWIQILEGVIKVDNFNYEKKHLIFLPINFFTKIFAEKKSELLYVKIPDATLFDKKLTGQNKNLRSINWFKEPVLNSEYDNRKRIYVMSEELTNTSAAKGEIIIYPPNTSAPEHYHAGAEHFQFIMSGEGIAVLEGKEHKLEKFDLLYHFEKEKHWFYNKSKSDFVFVEFFVPGNYKTVWSPNAKVCTWSPTGKNYLGEVPSRKIERHISGKGKNI